MQNRKKTLKLLVLADIDTIVSEFAKINIVVDASSKTEIEKFVDFLDTMLQANDPKTIDVLKGLELSVSSEYAKKIEFLQAEKIVTTDDNKIKIDFFLFIEIFYITKEVIEVVKYGIEKIRELIEKRKK